MTTPISIFSLFVVQTADEWLEYGLALARIAGLPVDTWRTGDPTKSLYKYLAESLATLESQNSEFIKAGFLSQAEGDWLTVLASEVYGVDREEATFATPTVTITNSGGGYYPIEIGDLVVKASGTGKTFRNTDAHVDPGDVLEPGATVVFQLAAEEAGSDSTVAADEIDEIVSPALIGCVIDSSTAATAQDEQDDDSLKEQCGDTLGALSPNGPADAYEYVVRNSDLTGSSEITKAKSTNDATDGTVTVYVAGASGAVTAGAVTAAQTAVETWATPLCITPTVTNSTPQSIALTATVTGDELPADFETQIEDAFVALLASTEIEIGGLVSLSRLYQMIHETVTATTVTISAPAADVNLSTGEVATAGTVTVTEV